MKYGREEGWVNEEKKEGKKKGEKEEERST